jgi:hypothetical protein
MGGLPSGIGTPVQSLDPCQMKSLLGVEAACRRQSQRAASRAQADSNNAPQGTKHLLCDSGHNVYHSGQEPGHQMLRGVLLGGQFSWFDVHHPGMCCSLWIPCLY